MINNYIMDQSPRITMTLSEILANTPPVQTLAQATDVPGTNLEWMKTAAYPTGAWYGDLGELGTTVFRDALFTGYLARGVTCKVSGVPYSWGGSYWIALASLGGGIVYDGTTYPLPLTAPHKGYKIAVVNPAVPDGWSTLKWTGTGWAPPRGELIASVWRGASPVALVTPGVTAVTQIYAGQPAPDYMIPNLTVMEITGYLTAQNASGVAGCLLSLNFCGSVPTAIEVYQSPLGASITPPSTVLGVNVGVHGKIQRVGAELNSGSGDQVSGNLSNRAGIFASGLNRIYAMAKPSSPTDLIQFDGCSVIAMGNL